MRQIQLSQNLWTMVDEDDFSKLCQYNWYADVNHWTAYAKTDNLPKRPRMHCVIMEPPVGFIVHHKDGNGLNNQKANLDVITQREHSRLSNLRRNKGGSLFRGVYKHGRKFAAEAWIDYRKHYLGIFETEIEVAIAYNKKMEQLVGDKFTRNVV